MNDLEKKNLKELAAKLGVKFKDLSLLKKALIHRSYLNENGVEESNERLEFLGDAVLELLTSRFLFDNYQASTEGDLTSFRAALVRTESLAETSKDLLIGQYIYMSKGEETTGGRDRTYILANTFEAILGAIYMDQGLESCNTFLSKLLYVKIKDIVENRLDIDAKSKLQELAQETLKVTPTYETLSEEGPDHSKTFKMAVFLGDKKYGVGEGHSKQMAEQKSASEALKKLQK